MHENGFIVNTDAAVSMGQAVCRMTRQEICDHGNGGVKSLTSNGTVADRRGEGHHFSL